MDGFALADARPARAAPRPHPDKHEVVRVLHVVETALGGCGTYLNEIVPIQVGRFGAGNVRVVAPDRHLRQMGAVDRAMVTAFRRPGRLTGLLHLALAVRAACREHRPTVVHAHSTFAGLVVRLLGVVSARGAVIVYCPHGWAFDIHNAKPVRAMVRVAERLLSFCCDRVVAISAAESSHAIAAGIDPERVSVIHNGIAATAPAAPAAPWSGDRRKVLFVGRLDHQKGLDVLLAAGRSCGERLSIRVVGQRVVGDTDHADARGLDVEYLGWLDPDAVDAQMRACDVLAVPSRWEGFGLVALEAMRAGKPVVASGVGGLPEVVQHGVTGLLVPPEDPARLREALLDPTDHDLRRMGEEGRERFLRHFTSDRLCQSLEALYVSLLAARALAVARPAAVAVTHA